LHARIKDAQLEDPECAKIKQLLAEGKAKEFCLKEDELLTHFKQLCVPGIGELRKEVMSEAHHSPYAVHPGGTKMYRDVKGVILVEQYEGHCKVCIAVFDLPASEGGASETGVDA
jgi:hypothetical protein